MIVSFKVEMISVILLSLILFLLGVQFLKLQWKSRGFPPGPIPLPIVGGVWRINFRTDHRSLKKVCIFEDVNKGAKSVKNKGWLLVG